MSYEPLRPGARISEQEGLRVGDPEITIVIKLCGKPRRKLRKERRLVLPVGIPSVARRWYP